MEIMQVEAVFKDELQEYYGYDEHEVEIAWEHHRGILFNNLWDTFSEYLINHVKDKNNG